MSIANTESGNWVNQRNARTLVLAVFLLKMAIVVSNTIVYRAAPYDYHWHGTRAASAGLRVDAMAYNPPLYYLPCLPFVEDVQKGEIKEGYTRRALIDVLRATNIGYFLIFYLCWLYVIVPAFIRDWRAATMASLVLLALPGFQKTAVMSGPDNALAGLSALAFAGWIWFRKREARVGWRDWAAIAGYAALVGLVGNTRPFAAVPVFVLCLAGLITLFRRHRLGWRFLSRALLMICTVGVISLPWYLYRWHETGMLKAAYNEAWVGPFRPYRDKVDRTHYFTSFYFVDLLREPNLLNPAIGYDGRPKSDSTMANSFPTIAYSEFWGDHWLYFSSQRYRTEGKLWPKRLLFVVALPMLPLLAWRFVRSLVLITRRILDGDEDADTNAILLLYFVLGVALYMYWLTGEALLPGANTPIKFMYNTHVVPVFVTLAFLGTMSERRFLWWLGYTTLLFVFRPTNRYLLVT